MPKWCNGTAMLSQALNSPERTALMYVSREAYEDMKFSGMYMHRGDVADAPLEYIHPFGRILIYASRNVMDGTPPEMHAERTEPRRQETIDHANHGFPENTADEPVENDPEEPQPEAGGLIQFINEYRGADNREFTWHTTELTPRRQTDAEAANGPLPGQRWVTETTRALRNYNRTTQPFFHITGTGVAT